MLAVFDTVREASVTGMPLAAVTTAYFGIGSRLGLDRLRDRIRELPARWAVT